MAPNANRAHRRPGASSVIRSCGYALSIRQPRRSSCDKMRSWFTKQAEFEIRLGCGPQNCFECVWLLIYGPLPSARLLAGWSGER